MTASATVIFLGQAAPSTPAGAVEHDAATWTSLNPTLLAGQFGYETDTHKLKVGDGTTAWTGLSYTAGSSGGGAVTSVNTHTGVVVLGYADVGADPAGAAAGAQSAAEAASDPSGTAAAAVATEAISRAAGDATNAAAITSEATARAGADTTLAGSISTEATARAAGDSTNASAISAEVTRAEAAEATNATAIATEVTNRGTAVTAEASARAAADTTNANAIAAEVTRAEAAEATNATAITTEATARASGDTAAISTAESFATAAVATEATARASGDTAAISTAESFATSAVAAEATARGTAITSAVATETTRAEAAEATKLALRTRATVITGSTFTIVAGETTPIDTTSNPITGTLPLASSVPAGTQAALKIITPGGPGLLPNAATVLCAGSDHINRSTSSPATSATLAVYSQGLTLESDGTSIWTAVADDIGKTQLDALYVPLPLTLPRFGRLRVLSHSYGSYNGRSSLVGNSSNFIRRVAAAMNIPVNEIDFWFHAGMVAGSPNIGDVTTDWGIGGLFRHSYPEHLYGAPSGTSPSATSKADPFLDLICLGINDTLGGAVSTSTMSTTAMTNGMRAAMTRLRAGRIYACDDAACVYSGTWTQLTDKNYVTFGKYKSTSTLNDTMTFTIPTTYTGGPIAISLLGCPNFKTTIAAGSNGVNTSTFAGSGTLNVATNGANLAPLTAGTILVATGGTAAVITYTGKTASTFTGCTTISGGGVMSTGGNVTQPITTAYLDFTSSTANLDGNGAGVAPVSVRGFDGSGHLPISGQGTSGSPGGAVTGTDIQMVARFVHLTSADAGKTIVATLKGVSSGEVFRPFDVIIEDVDPPAQLVVNQPACIQAFKANVDFKLNPALVTLVGEFANAYLVDVETLFDNLFGATIQTATGTGESTVKITPRSASLNVLSKGSITRADTESFLITSVDKTNAGANDGTWLCGVTTNYTGLDAPAGAVASAGNANHAIGAEFNNVLPWSVADGLHQSDEGHLLYASQVIATIGTIPVTTKMIAASGGYVAHDNQEWPAPASGVAYPLYRSSSGARGTKTLTQSTEWAEPFWIPRNGLLTYFGCWVTTGAASSVLRFGYYTDVGMPGALIFDLGTLATPGSTTAANGTFVSQACAIPVKRGWYWRSVIAQGGAPTVTGVSARSPVLGYTMADPSSNANGNAPAGFTQTGITAALADWAAAITIPAADNATFPLIEVGYETFITG